MAKALKTSPEGRKCLFPGCNQILSIYNHQEYCRIHLEQMTSKDEPKPYKHAFSK